MSRLASAVHAYSTGSHVNKSMLSADKVLKSYFFDRGQAECRMAATLLRQDPSMSRTDALLSASDLLDRAEQFSLVQRDSATLIPVRSETTGEN